MWPLVVRHRRDWASADVAAQRVEAGCRSGVRWTWVIQLGFELAKTPLTVMETIDYNRWWPLHLRVSRGEQLPDEDRDAYAAGLRELEGAEIGGSSANSEAIEAAGQTIAQLERQQQLLRARRDKLDAEICATEVALKQRARELLGAQE